MGASSHTPNAIAIVRRLVMADLSRSQVAHKMGVSRNTIAGIANRHLTKS